MRVGKLKPFGIEIRTDFYVLGSLLYLISFLLVLAIQKGWVNLL